MKCCRQCGATLPDNTGFCGKCGRKQEEEKPIQNKEKLSLWYMVLGLVIVFVIAGGMIVGGVVALRGKTPESHGPVSMDDNLSKENNNEKSKEVSAHVTYEGNGYDTAKDAVGAYVKALNTGDLDAVASCYCIESFCERADYTTLCTSYLHFLPSPQQSEYDPAKWVRDIPLISETGPDLRRSEIIKQTFSNIYYLTFLDMPEFEFIWDWRETKAFEDEQHEQAFLEQYHKAIREDMPDLASLELIACCTPEEVAALLKDNVGLTEEDMKNGEGWWGQHNQDVLKAREKSYGADELQELVAVIRIEGREWLMAISTLRYADKWFIFSTDGNMRNWWEGFFADGLMPLDIELAEALMGGKQ